MIFYTTGLSIKNDINFGFWTENINFSGDDL